MGAEALTRRRSRRSGQTLPSCASRLLPLRGALRRQDRACRSPLPARQGALLPSRLRDVERGRRGCREPPFSRRALAAGRCRQPVLEGTGGEPR